MASNSNYSTFTYQSLAPGHIRLLRISKNEERLGHKLSHVDLNSAPKYLTLSYTWAGQARDKDLVINGSVLKVILNLKTVLPYLHERYQSQYFWIDGICIDQENDREKEVQIPLMKKIYTQAEICVVWLGESTSPIDLAIPIIPTIVGKFQGYDFRLGFHEQSLTAQGLPSLTSLAWVGLDDLFCNYWFTRIWTFQEAVLPKSVEILCGGHFVSLDMLADLATSMLCASQSGTIESITDAVDEKKQSAQNGMKRIVTVQSVRNQRNEHPTSPYPFLYLLSKSLSWSCSNPLDKIYGLLGLADRSLQDNLVIDYTISPAEVYLAFANCWVPRDLHLDFLHLIPSSNDLLELPTWCPNFSCSPPATPLGPFSPSAQYRAGIKAGKLPHISISDDCKAISVQGFRVDKIAEVLPCPWERQNHVTTQSKNEGIAELLEWETKCLELSQSAYNTRDKVPPAHWRTLIANKNAGGELFKGRGLETYHLARFVMSKLATTQIRLSPTERLLSTKPITNSKLLKVQDMGEALGYASCGRSFFSTRDGRVGLGPLHSQPGDVVCIFHNGYTPYVIRPKEENHTRITNQFIGESYVDGLMYGKAFSIVNRSPDEIFTLV